LQNSCGVDLVPGFGLIVSTTKLGRATDFLEGDGIAQFPFPVLAVAPANSGSSAKTGTASGKKNRA